MTIDLPHWVMKFFIEAAERAYRRGFQHGLLEAEDRGTLHNDPKISRWRSANFRLGDHDGSPNDPNSLTIERRHTGCDGPHCHLFRESRKMWRIWYE
jgi:hypothetical protein